MLKTTLLAMICLLAVGCGGKKSSGGSQTFDHKLSECPNIAVGQFEKSDEPGNIMEIKRDAAGLLVMVQDGDNVTVNGQPHKIEQGTITAACVQDTLQVKIADKDGVSTVILKAKGSGFSADVKSSGGQSETQEYVRVAKP